MSESVMSRILCELTDLPRTDEGVVEMTYEEYDEFERWQRSKGLPSPKTFLGYSLRVVDSADQARLERLNAPLPEPREEDAIYRIRKTLRSR